MFVRGCVVWVFLCVEFLPGENLERKGAIVIESC